MSDERPPRDDEQDEPEERPRSRDRDDDLFERRDRQRSRDRRDDEDRDDRSRSRGRDDFDDDFDDRRGPPVIPNQLRIAGYIWIIIGIIILINGVILLGIIGQGGDKGVVVGGSCGVILIALFGGVFIHVGMQSNSGTARDTLGNGIGSILIGLLQAGSAIVYLNAGHTFPAIVGFAGCAGLLIAGVFAIMARADYLEYRRYIKQSDRRRGRDFD
jgi:hypothetical protein